MDFAQKTCFVTWSIGFARINYLNTPVGVHTTPFSARMLVTDEAVCTLGWGAEERCCGGLAVWD